MPNNADLPIFKNVSKAQIHMLSLRTLALVADIISFWFLLKLFGYILLSVLLGIPIMILGTSEAWIPEDNIGHWIFFGMVVLFTLRESLFSARHRQSLGKSLMGIEVVDTKTQKPASI